MAVDDAMDERQFCWCMLEVMNAAFMIEKLRCPAPAKEPPTSELLVVCCVSWPTLAPLLSPGFCCFWLTLKLRWAQAVLRHPAFANEAFTISFAQVVS